MSDLERAIVKIIDERIEKTLEAKLPEMIRALAVSEAKTFASSERLLDATEAARMLGYDVSTEEEERSRETKSMVW